MPSDEQTAKLIAPVSCINVGEILRPVDHVRAELAELAEKRVAKQEEIDTTSPDSTDLLEKLKRDLTGINAAIDRLEHPMKIRLGHAYTPITPDSA
jgi:hypothetical protein